MGCCGCSNKASATTAGVFGLIQGLVWLILDAYFLHLYTSSGSTYRIDKLDDDERLYLLYITRDIAPVIIILLIVAALLNSIWIISSIILIPSSSGKGSCAVRQWVVITSFVIIGDIILPVVAGIFTALCLNDLSHAVVQKVQSTVNNNEYNVVQQINTAVSDVKIVSYTYYVLLLFTFTRLGLISLIINICLNVFTNRRASEISNPQGYVVAPSTLTVITMPGQFANPAVQHVPPPYVPGQTYGPPGQYFPGNIPLQPANGFSNQAEGICNDLNEPLIPPKDGGNYC